MSKILRSLLLVLAMGAGCAAQAALIDVSQAPRAISADLDLYSSAELPRQFSLADWSAQPGAANNFFTDRYDFSLTGYYMAGGFVQSDLLSAVAGLQFTGLKLYGSGGLLLAGLLDSSDDMAQVWTLGSITLGPGDYYLEVSGHANGLNAEYNGVLGVAQAVPEPASLAIMVTGLGLMGLVRRRKV